MKFEMVKKHDGGEIKFVGSYFEHELQNVRLDATDRAMLRRTLGQDTPASEYLLSLALIFQRIEQAERIAKMPKNIRLGSGSLVSEEAMRGVLVEMLSDQEHGDWKTALARGITGVKKGDRVTVERYFSNLYGHWFTIRKEDGSRIDVPTTSVRVVVEGD